MKVSDNELSQGLDQVGSSLNSLFIILVMIIIIILIINYMIEKKEK